MKPSFAAQCACVAMLLLFAKPSLAASEMYAEIQGDAAARANVLWFPGPTADISSRGIHSAAAVIAGEALIMGGTAMPSPSHDIEFDFRERYLNPPPSSGAQLFTPPAPTIEWYNTQTKTSTYENLLFDKFEKTDTADGYKHAKRTVKTPENCVVKRVAVVAKSKDNAVTRLSVRNFKLDGKGPDKVNLVFLCDEGDNDQLLNVANHTAGK